MRTRRSSQALGLVSLASFAIIGVAALPLPGCELHVPAPPENTESHPAAVVGGGLDVDDPAVVAILPRRSDCVQTTPTPTCTGTLIAPRVVLTAAHCINDPKLRLEVYFGASTIEGSGRFDVVTEVRVDPKYDPTTHAHDVAVLRLADDPGVAPVKMGALAGVTVGTAARVVGFGVDGSDSSIPGVKRQGLTKISAIDSASFRAEPGPAMSCAGDSGGPVLVAMADGGGEVLTGVTSAGDTPCKSYAIAVRIDAVRDFIDPFVAETEKSPAGLLPGSIELHALCTQRCSSAGDCPAALGCTPFGGGTCAIQGGTPVSFAGECSATSSCPMSARCARVWPSGPGACRCAIPCEGAPTAPMPSTSASASTTTGPSLQPSDYRAGGGGCASAREAEHGARSTIPLAAIIAAGAVAMRRRRTAQP